MNIKAKGVSLEVKPIYSAGHVCTEAEAKALDNARADAVRGVVSNYIRQAEKKNPEFKPSAEKIAEWQSYADGFQIGAQRAKAGRAKDPVEHEAKILARDRVRRALKAKGGDWKNGSLVESLATQLLDRDPTIREAAARIVAAKADVAAASPIGEMV